MPHPREHTKDNDRFIASARRHCLLIFALGILSAQLAWAESERRRVYDIHSYLEKTLSVVVAIQAGTWSRGESRALNETDNEVNFDAINFKLIKAMTKANEVTELTFKNPSVSLSTRADPIHSCAIKAFRFQNDNSSGSGDPLILDVKTAVTAYDTVAMVNSNLETAVMIGYSSFCRPVISITDAVIYVKYGEEDDQVGLVFSRSVYNELGIEWGREVHTAQQWIKIVREAGLLTEPQEARLLEFDKPSLEALDLPLVKGLILKTASEISGQTYTQNELDNAMKVILEGVNESESIWGLRVSPRMAAVLVPIAFFVLSFLLLHRVRRINPKMELMNEPWVVIRPVGIIEISATVAWYVSLVLAGVAVSWSVWSYQSDDWRDISEAWTQLWLFPANDAVAEIGITSFAVDAVGAVFGSSLVWGLIASLLSLVLIFRSCTVILKLSLQRANANAGAADG